MKNLKKVLALVVALTMVLGTVSFAFTDVAEDSDVYTAVQTLSSLSILNGYEDGTFGPEKDITRAEFATVVCRALGYTGGGSVATQFADVPADHWASAFIGYAAGLGIVNGYGDGNFGPEDNVTYEQAVKMLVVALGFEPMAAQKGGYPTGYLVVANTYGLADDVKAPADNAAANRGIVAQLTYNALDICMMDQTGFGTETVYKIHDGINAPYKTLLTGLDVEKLDGVVMGTSVIGGYAADEVYFDVKDNYDSTEIAEAARTFKVAEGVDAAKYFGYASTIYVKEVKNDWVVIAIMPGEESATLTLEKKDINVLSNGELKYWASASASKTTNEKVLNPMPSSSVIINNVPGKTLANVRALGDDAEITFIENDGDSTFDMIIAKSYAWGVIDAVEADKDRLSVKTSSSTVRFSFDFEDEDVSYTIVNKDGEDISIADFAEGDVIAYILDGGNRTAGTYNWIEVINLGQNVVTGAVTETNTSKNIVCVDGVEYEIAAGAYAPSIGEEGTFFLTKAGKIFNSEIDASVASNYAYILEMGIDDGSFSKCWQIKLLTKEGKVETYEVKDTFSVGYVDSAANELASYDKADSAATLGLLANAAIAGANSYAEFKASPADRIVTYKLDSNNKIKELRFVASEDIAPVSSSAEWNANAGAIGTVVLDEDAVVINLVSDKMENAFATTVNSLVNEGQYGGYVISNADNDKDLFVVTEGKGAIDLSQDIAIVDSKNTIDIDGDTAWKIRYYASNDETLKEITITEDTEVEFPARTTISGLLYSLDQGDIIMLADDGNGVATNVALLATANTYDYTIHSDAVSEFAGEQDLAIYADYIDTLKAVKNGTNLTMGDGTTITLKGDVNAYTFYQRASGKASVMVGDYMGATVDVKDTDTNKVSYFFAITENGVVTDIVTIATPERTTPLR